MKHPDTTPLTLEQARQHFAHSGGYLNSASIGLPPREVVEAVQKAVDDWSTGHLSAAMFDQSVDIARAGYAALCQVPVDWVTINASVSSLIGLVALSVRSGAEVLCAEGEFTSLLFPFLERAQAGEIKVREVPLEALIDAIGPNTAMVAVSAVQSADGRVVDLRGLAQAAAQHGAQTMIDATQAVGWLPLDASLFDYVATGAYKWLLAPRGAAFMSVRPERIATLRPTGAGWYAGQDIWDSIYGSPLRLASSARRFDVSPAWLSWVGAAHALSFVQRVGVATMHNHNVALANAFLDQLDLPPQDSAIVSLRRPGAGASLKAAGVTSSERNGATRLSFHLYNDLDDATRAAEVIRERRD